MAGLGLIGFGRVGRTLTRVLHQRGALDSLACISELNPSGRDPAELTANLAYLLAQDSVYGPFSGEVSAEGENLIINGRPVRCCYFADPREVDWAGHGVKLVVEATGDPTATAAASGLLERGVVKVVITRQEAASHIALVRGLNLEDYDPARHHLISCSTCTANALAPVLSVIDHDYGVAWAGVASIHPALSCDTLLDGPADQFALGRSGLGVRAASSGVAESVGRLLPRLAERISAMTFRVPSTTVNALLADMVLQRPPAEAGQVLAMLEQAAAGPLAGVMRLDHGFLGRPRAAEDFKADPHSAVVDAAWLELKGPMLRLLLWHDNEWGYCQRAADIIQRVSSLLT